MLCCHSSFCSPVYAALSCFLFVKTWVQPKWHQHPTPLATITKPGWEQPLGFWWLVATEVGRGHFAQQKHSLLAVEPTPLLTASHKLLTQQQKPGRGANLPCERVDFQGKLLEQGGFSGVGQDQDDVHVPWPQAHQVTGVVDVR